jgi:hypothetical protein
MKPGRHDVRYQVLITGAELHELQRHTALMAESFGLDRRIEAYRGIRPLSLYRWDLECLLAALGIALADQRRYPSPDAAGYQALQALNTRLQAEYDAHYRERSLKSPPRGHRRAHMAGETIPSQQDGAGPDVEERDPSGARGTTSRKARWDAQGQRHRQPGE